MRTVFADFNAMTESGAVRLGCQGSQDDLRERGIEVGDWMWLSDGELVVGAQLATDDRDGPIGVPRWKTLVHLDDELGDFHAIQRQYDELRRNPHSESDAETKLFQLLTILDVIKPSSEADHGPSPFAAGRVGALLLIDEPELALVNIKEAMDARPGDPDVVFHYLETLKLVDLDRAAREATRRAQAEGIDAFVLAACINIWSAVADRASEPDFQAIGPRIFQWASRFEQAPRRDQIPPTILAGVLFNRGLTLLRMGRLVEAKGVLGLARAIDPDESAIDEALNLDVFDERAREIAAKFRRMPLPNAA